VAKKPRRSSDSRAGSKDRTPAIVAIVLALLLITVVVPAWFGIDPVGTGRALGLTGDVAVRTPATPASSASSNASHDPQYVSYISDSRKYTLPISGAMEFMYHLNVRGGMVYGWKATGEVEFDLHNEPTGKPEAAQSVEKGSAREQHGSYVAAYDGLHGWYWRNNTNQPVTIDLTASGFFRGAQLFHADGSSEPVSLPGR
jgi:hypothetical protein